MDLIGQQMIYLIYWDQVLQTGRKAQLRAKSDKEKWTELVLIISIIFIWSFVFNQEYIMTQAKISKWRTQKLLQFIVDILDSI